jgi:hypothetical protein
MTMNFELGMVPTRKTQWSAGVLGYCAFLRLRPLPSPSSTPVHHIRDYPNHDLSHPVAPGQSPNGSGVGVLRRSTAKSSTVQDMPLSPWLHPVAPHQSVFRAPSLGQNSLLNHHILWFSRPNPQQIVLYCLQPPLIPPCHPQFPSNRSVLFLLSVLFRQSEIRNST